MNYLEAIPALHVHCRISCSSQDTETTKVSIHSWMENVCVCVCVYTGAHLRYQPRDHYPVIIEASTVTSAFEERMRFIVRLTSEEMEDRSQICLPHPTFRVKFKGLGEFQTWELIV